MVRVRHILFRNIRGHVQAKHRVRFLFDDLPFQSLDGLFDHLHVQIEPDRGDVAGLLFPEQIARAANFQISGGDPEARSEFRELLDGREPFLGVACQRPFVRHEEIGVGLVAAPADPSAQLV